MSHLPLACGSLLYYLGTLPLVSVHRRSQRSKVLVKIIESKTESKIKKSQTTNCI